MPRGLVLFDFGVDLFLILTAMDLQAPATAELRLSKALMDQVEAISRSSKVPVCVKKVIDAITTELSACRAQNEELKKELDALRSKVPPEAYSQEKSSSFLNTTLQSEPSRCGHASAEELERQRSIVVFGVPESDSSKSRERVAHDFVNLCNIIDFLNIDCSPVSVYRLGKKSSPSHNRPLKVVLPARVFQRIALNRARRLRFFSDFRVFLRESLPPEELKRRREERNTTSVDTNRGSTSGQVQGLPATSTSTTPVVGRPSAAQGN